LVAWLLAISGDWRLPFIVLGVVGVLMAIGWWVIVRDTPDVHPWATKAEADELADDNSSSAAAAEAAGQVVEPLSHYLKRPLVLATAAAFFGYAWVLYTFLSWFPVYLVEARGVQLKDVAWIGALPWVVGVIGYVLGGVVTDRIALRTGNPAAARKGMIVFGLTGTALLIAGIGLVSSLVTAVALMSAVVFLLYLTGSQYFTLISDTIPAARLGGVVGFVHFIANLSGIFAPFLVGVIVDQTKSWPLTFGVSAGICIAGVVGLLIWGRLKPSAPLS
jgi:ACS family hexuronate transporter-like MFS transporter